VKSNQKRLLFLVVYQDQGGQILINYFGQKSTFWIRFIRFRQKKTKGAETLPISDQGDLLGSN
jgi:hypothetical protein